MMNNDDNNKDFYVYYFKPQTFSKNHVGRCLITEIDLMSNCSL